jgi:hypothetical protein
MFRPIAIVLLLVALLPGQARGQATGLSFEEGAKLLSGMLDQFDVDNRAMADASGVGDGLPNCSKKQGTYVCSHAWYYADSQRPAVCRGAAVYITHRHLYWLSVNEGKIVNSRITMDCALLKTLVSVDVISPKMYNITMTVIQKSTGKMLYEKVHSVIS